MNRTCLDCPATISRLSTGRCRRCAARATATDPAWRAKQRAGSRAKFDDPAHRALHAARLAERNRNAPPALKAAMRANGRRSAETLLNSPELRAIVNDPAMKAENGRKGSATKLAWCPPAYREIYLQLQRSQRLRAAEARRLVEELIAADRAREAARTAALTPFERQMAAVAAGAKLIPRFEPRRADFAFTLGGVAPEAI